MGVSSGWWSDLDDLLLEGAEVELAGHQRLEVLIVGFCQVGRDSVLLEQLHCYPEVVIADGCWVAVLINATVFNAITDGMDNCSVEFFQFTTKVGHWLMGRSVDPIME